MRDKNVHPELEVEAVFIPKLPVFASDLVPTLLRVAIALGALERIGSAAQDGACALLRLFPSLLPITDGPRGVRVVDDRAAGNP